MKQSLSFLSFIVLFCTHVHAQQSLAKKIDQLLGGYQQKGQFDGSVLLAKNENVIYQNQFGWANRQFNVPITLQTKFPVASISKLYTAILVLKLQEQGKLNIDSPLANYVPELLPKNSRKITLRQLLVHTSGLPNEKTADYLVRLNPQDFIKKRIADTLLFTPGSKYSYNNVNFIMLANVMEKVSGKKWTALLNDFIIEPLQLQQTGVVKRDSVIQNMAYGYHNYAFGNEKVKDPLENDDPLFLENYATAGAIFTVPLELLKLNLALANGQILKQPSLDLLYQTATSLGKVENRDYEVASGGYVGYTQFGNKKAKVIERNGNIMGYNATYLQLPETQHILIIFCNTDAGYLSKIAEEVLALALFEK